MEIKWEHRITEVEERSKSNTKRLDDMERRQNNLDELVGTVKVLAEKEKRVESDVQEIKRDVKTLTEKPAKRWDLIITVAITALITGLVGFCLSQIGLK